MNSKSSKVAPCDKSTTPADILEKSNQGVREIEDGPYARLTEFVWWRLAQGRDWELVLGYSRKRLQLLRVPRRGEPRPAELRDVGFLSQDQRQTALHVLIHGISDAIQDAQDSYDDCDERSRY